MGVKQILSVAGAVMFEGVFETLRDCVFSLLKTCREKGTRANLSRADLSRADLSRADLSRADLSRADLYGADLSSANLSRADLYGADLSRADLSGADLYGANLSGANLSGANLSGANLSRANLSRANLSGANLSRANLSRADLYGADLSSAKSLPASALTAIRDDVWAVLSSAPTEAPAVLEALRGGRVDGSTYNGGCACLVGTIANARKCSVAQLGALKPNSERLAERWFMAISPGDTPKTSEACKRAAGWVEDWILAVRNAFAPVFTCHKEDCGVKVIAAADAEDAARKAALQNYVGKLKPAKKSKSKKARRS